jgi:hypothetical protein
MCESFLFCNLMFAFPNFNQLWLDFIDVGGREWL